LKHCYDVTKTVCDEVSDIITREVCVYPYVQKPAMALAHMTEIGFETKFRGMEVSRCHTYTEIGVEGVKEVEKCTNDYVEKEFLLPIVQEGFEDFIELDIPDPQSDCRIFRFDVPYVICRDITTTECTEIVYLDEALIPAEIVVAIPKHKPSCAPQVLTQHRQVCSINPDSPKNTTGKLQSDSNDYQPKFLDSFFQGSQVGEEEFQITFAEDVEDSLFVEDL